MSKTVAAAATTLLLLAPHVSVGDSTQVQAPRQAELLAWWADNGVPPLEYVTSKFESHDWVFLGEYHRIRDDVDLVGTLIPELHRKTRVRHLALEFLCADRIDEANELITRDAFDRGEAIDFFRAQFAGWAYEEYLDLFRTAWESNQVFAEERGPFRLVGLHPCIRWEVVNYSQDPDSVARELAKRDAYDEVMARSLEDNLLRPGIPAVVFTGIAHSTARFVEYRSGTDEQLLRMGNLVYREPWADGMFFIALHAPFWDAGTNREIYPFDGVLDRMMLEYRAPIGFDVVATAFESLTHETRSERSITAYEFGELYDGYIMHETPLKETVGVTCIPDWIESEGEFEYFWRNLSNLEASERFSREPFEEFVADFCAPRPEHGILFSRRFRTLPDLE